MPLGAHLDPGRVGEPKLTRVVTDRGDRRGAVPRGNMSRPTLRSIANTGVAEAATVEPGTPIQNAFVESFQGYVRDECLDQHWRLGLGDTRHTVEAWRQDDHRVRPYSALGYRPLGGRLERVERPEVDHSHALLFPESWRGHERGGCELWVVKRPEDAAVLVIPVKRQVNERTV